MLQAVVSSIIESRMHKLGHFLPPPSTPKGNYASFVRSGNKIYLSGHLPIPATGAMAQGRLGENVSIEDGQFAAKLAGLQLLATLKVACGDLDRVKKIVKITGFVNSVENFTNQPTVINGCSDLLGEVFGEQIGKHTTLCS